MLERHRTGFGGTTPCLTVPVTWGPPGQGNDPAQDVTLATPATFPADGTLLSKNQATPSVLRQLSDLQQNLVA